MRDDSADPVCYVRLPVIADDRSDDRAADATSEEEEMRPIPLPLPMAAEKAERLTFDNIDRFKNTDCVHYENCLTIAANGNWPQFHCGGCRAYEEAELNELEIKALTRFFGDVL